ncbi:hypothetical protein [Maribacter polysiphoniae]|uniref:hypothetical protein n=1 Tax=Maribacter polysiphoniae TaxID=429344 RepID=UPI0023578EAF|nr:hypothetical protein [Maribacter polysiphoniae]
MKKGTDIYEDSKDVQDMGVNIAKSGGTSFDKKIYVLKNPTMAIIKCWDEKHRDLGIFDMNNLKMNSNQHYKTS